MECWRRAVGLRPCTEVSPVVLDVPTVLQRDDISCGPACVRAVLKFWKVRGASVPSADAMDGVHPLNLEIGLRAAGLRVFSGELDVETLRVLTRLGRPVVCLVRAESDGHWVVVRSVQRGRVLTMCPLNGYMSESVAEFESRWYDTDRKGTVFRSWGVCAWRG